eukprot:TRINITY_DN4354_c0_g1_i2.p1 TRINITY_DN4354_c0_g1~~TRINITY_DN4354_c0_g1_i2.p1  ORF type:complete len:284 (-),score=57.02 TRINITY_DN4354_c0_g1_i2:85-936(-)
MDYEQLNLDPSIRNWVLIPLVVVMFVVSILRDNITRITKTEKKPDLQSIQQTQTLIRTRRLISNAHKIPYSSFEQRKQTFIDKEKGILAVRGGTGEQNALMNPMMNPMMGDPSNMMDMMKGNLTTILPQILLMTWVTHFFSGFVAAKVPFSLTERFRPLLQRGIELSHLDVTYVTSLSWYFLVMFGLRGAISLVLGEGNASDDTRMMFDGGMGAMTQQQQQIDITKVYTSERENLELVSHDWAVQNAEEKLLFKKGVLRVESVGSPNPRLRKTNSPKETKKIR